MVRILTKFPCLFLIVRPWGDLGCPICVNLHLILARALLSLRLFLSVLLALCFLRTAEIVKSRFVVTFADSPGQPNRIAPSYVTTSVSRVTEMGGE